MARSFKELRGKMSPERHRRNRNAAQIESVEMTLQEIRKNLTSFNQEELAEALEVTQGRISRLEGQEDILVSKLYEYVHALGGELELRVRFPDEKEVAVWQFNQFKELRRTLGGQKANPKKTG
jgi:predicted XRE-type DNA-binding protein